MDAAPEHEAEDDEQARGYVDDHRRASLAVTWASLDCVGGWAGDLVERPMVLGRMTARVDALPVVGEPHVVVGGAAAPRAARPSPPRRCTTPTAGSSAGAEHVWIAVDPAAPSALTVIRPLVRRGFALRRTVLEACGAIRTAL